MIIFKDRLRLLRDEKECTLKELALELDVTTRTLMRYEAGDMDPSMSRIIALAEFFDVSTDYLLGISNSKNIDDANRLNEIAESLASTENSGFILQIMNFLKLIDDYDVDSDLKSEYIEHIVILMETLRSDVSFLATLQEMLAPDKSIDMEDLVRIIRFTTTSKHDNDFRLSVVSYMSKLINRESSRLMSTRDEFEPNFDMDAVELDINKLRESIKNKK